MLLETLIKDIRYLVNSSEIKYNKLAKKYETVDSAKESDMYISAVLETDTFDGYLNFSVDALMNAGLNFPEYDPFELAKNKYNIPYNKRQDVIKAQRKEIIDNYVEKNNYYRMLNGLPNIEDTPDTYIKLSEDELLYYGIDASAVNGLYLHQYSDKIIYNLNDAGYIDSILEKYPDKKYVKYLGVNKIPIINARQANNFSILKIGNEVPDEFYNQFLTVYEQNREYFMTALYIQDYSTTYDLYDNFMALCIMIMTIQRLVSNAFKSGIQRDFYDWQFIQNMYKMYNVPFVEDLPIEQHVVLVKNLNNLLRYKSTDKVLFDICSLLGYERMKIFRYYLVKEHRLDENEKPLFIYKKATDENGNIILDDKGNPIYVEDHKQMYDLYFQSVNIKERNMAIAMLDKTARLDYDEVTANDPYWWEDSDLQESKYANDFNYIETKYLSLNLMYKMTEMLFEITYAFRMLIDKRDEIDAISIDLPKIYQDKSFKLFDVIVFLIAIICKLNGFKENIITTASKISHIYGFNFNQTDIDVILQTIGDNSDKLEIDPDTNEPVIMKYFKDLKITTPDNVNELYAKIREYNDYIVDKMYNSTTIEEYRTYQKIFNISMTTDAQTSIFTITIANESGVEERVAETYSEYLYYSDRVLYDILSSLETADINTAVEHVLFKVNELIESLKYTYIVNDSTNPIFTSIVKLLRFFKSYTVDLTSFNIVYVFDSKYYNNIKLIEDIKSINKEIETKDNLQQSFADNIPTIGSKFDEDFDIIDMIEKYKYYLRLHLDDSYENQYSENELYDYMHVITKYSILPEYHLKNKLHDDVNINGYINTDTIAKMYDKLLTHIYINYKDKEQLKDLIENINTYMNIDNNISVTEKLKRFISNLYNSDDIEFTDEMIIESMMDTILRISIRDSFNIDSKITQKDEIPYSYSETYDISNTSLYLNESIVNREKLIIIRDE